MELIGLIAVGVSIAGALIVWIIARLIEDRDKPVHFDRG